MLHILNCLTDDKFIDNLIEVLDASSENVFHDFGYISDTKKEEFTYIKNANRIKVIRKDDFLPLLIKEKYDAVVLHNFVSLPIPLIISVPKNILVLWFAWGFDIYSMPVHKPLVKIANLYSPLTKEQIKGTILDRFRHCHAIIDSYLKRDILKRAIKRVDYFSGVLPNEYKLLQSNSFFKAQKVEFNYFSLNSNIKEDNINTSIAQSNNILVGNSGDPTNNHLDIFEYLHRLNLKDSNVYCFLSYGGTTDYKNKVKDVGLLYFGDHFIPIENFLPYNQFSDIIMSCGNVIMGHERQQAMGNVFQSLWNGCKLFLSETSVAYKYMKTSGYRLYTIQNDLNKSTINQKMNLQDIINNRKLLIKYNSSEVQMRKIYKIYEVLADHKMETNTNEQV
jgi:dTDP-N-acetylfucosamine:lipid II N-acetylfucosaminyltransferase